MRSKFDARIESKGKAIAKAAARKPSPVPGGKALQRLFHFLARRDPVLNDDVVAELGVPKAARPKFGLTRQAMRAKVPGPRTAKAPTRRRRRGASPEAKKFAAAQAKAADAHASVAAPPSTVVGQAITAIESLTTTAAPAWQFVGPTNITNGQTYGTNRVDVIGRVACIAVDPANAAHVLLGAAGGGIWESSNTGGTWAPRSDFLPSLAIGAIAFDPTSSSRVYAGSGEGNFYANLGAGVYKSTNGGTTWSVIASAPFVGVGFYDLIVDPNNAAILYAATTSGFYVSTNSGVNWALKRNVRCWDISVGVAGGATELLAAFQDGLFVSTNNGSTFTTIALPSDPAGTWNRLAVDHTKNSPGVAYAFGAKGSAAHLWRRNAGAWTKITTLPAIGIGQAWYDWYVAATPNDANEVYLGEIAGYRGKLSGATWTWTAIVTNGANSIHPDQHCLTFSPASSATIFAGNDGGIYRSTNKGASWTALNKGLGITEIEYMGSSPFVWDELIAGTQDNGTIRHSPGASTIWDHIADGDGGDCGIKQTTPNIRYHSFYNATLQRSTAAVPSVSSWTNLVPPPSASSLFYPPVEVADLTVVIGGAPLIYALNGDTATSASFLTLALPAGFTPSAMRALTPTEFLVGATSGALVRVIFVGATPSVTTLTTPRSAYMSCIAIDPSNPNRYWVTYSQIGGGRVYRSDNRGVSWTDCTRPALPNIPMNAVLVDPANYKRVFVAADVGVYESTDLGASWAVYGTGLPNAIAADLLLHAQDRRLVCGMRNRGAWATTI
jgi:hypothetical protein